ncbi:MAG: hypothetical protein WCW16_05105 [Candidatus Magasanikbacteria bacterium]
MQKKFILGALALGVLLFPSNFVLAVSPTNWPASSSLSDRITPTAPYEPSGMAWNSVSEKLFTISDGGVLTKMNKDGVVETEWRNIKREPPNATANADLEALVITDPHSNFIYLGEENPDSISQFDWSRGVKTGKSWDLSYHLNTPSNSGLEGAAFVPNAFLPSSVPDSIYGSGGLFYVGVQRAPTPGGATTTDDGLIYVFDLDVNHTGIFTSRGYITLNANGFTGLANSNISDMFFNEDTGTLFILYDDGVNLLIEVDPKTNKVVRAYTNVPGDGREGFLIRRDEIGGSIIYIAHDASTATYISKHTAVYYQDLDNDGLGSHVSSMISTLAAPTGYVANSNDVNDNDFDNDGISIGVDCNDANNTVLGPVNYYIDADGDGKGFGQARQSCTVLAGHVTNVEDVDDNDFDNDTISSLIDCNDRDYNIRGPQSYYLDLDGDGLGSGEAVLSCAVVSGRVTNSSDQNDNDHDNDNVNTGIDCDDNNNTVLGPINYYRDADGDGKRFGEPQIMCSASGTYVLTASSELDTNDNDYDNDNIDTALDCNDRDFDVKGPQFYYADVDGDGLGFGSARQSCMVVPGYVTNVDDRNDNDFDNDNVNTGTDCNDNNPAILGPINYYQDVDGDGRGSDTLQQSCTLVEGFVINSDDVNDHDYDNDNVEMSVDCDDHDVAVLGPVTYYRDYDQDGLGSIHDIMEICSEVPLDGFVTNHDDANDFDKDNDAVVDSVDNCLEIYNPDQNDTDQDGIGDACDEHAYDRDNDGVDASADCDDYNPQISTPVIYYHDLDYDGLGNPNDTLTLCSAHTPAGYVTNSNDHNDNDADNDGASASTDCNDHDPNVYQLKNFYEDRDDDGLGSKIVLTSVCSNSAPAGYVNNNLDFDDEIPARGIEIKGDKRDNDGDKYVDEVNTISQNGTHPFLFKLDPFDVQLAKRYMVSVTPTWFGKVQVTYSDHAVYEYSIFSWFIGSLRVEHYNNSAVLKVTKVRNGEYVYINGYTGARIMLP